MNHKDKALRIAFKAFRKMSLGTKFSAEELLTLSDLMGIALPMKHRFTKAELSEVVGVGPYTLASRPVVTRHHRRSHDGPCEPDCYYETTN